MNTNDLIKGVDFTPLTTVTAADLNQLVDRATLSNDRGLIWITTDTLDDVPQVPNPTGSIDFGKRYIWMRRPHSLTSSFTLPITYVWNELAISDSTYLKWVRLSAPIDNGTIGIAQLSDSINGLGIGLSATDGLIVNITTPTIATLRGINATNLVNNYPGLLVYVSGHTSANDGGEGFFELKAGTVTSADDDNGSKICSNSFPTFYWNRVVIGEKRFAEWFGAKGDGVISDRVAIQACITKYNRVDFKAKTYVVEGGIGEYVAISVHTNTIILGEGIDKTIIKLKNSATGASGATASPMSFFIFANQVYTTPCDYVTIKDLTINCNGSGQPNTPCSIGAIWIVGSGTLIDGVRSKQFVMGGTLSGAFEAVAVYCSLPSGNTDLTGPVIQNCEFSDIADNDDTTIPSYFPEINCIIIDCVQDANYTRYFNAPIIRNNRVIGLNQTATQKSPVHVFSIAGSKAALIVNNIVSQVNGIAVYFESSHSFDTLIEGNIFDRCWCALFFQVTGTSGFITYDGWFKNTTFSNNTWTAPESADYTPSAEPSCVLVNVYTSGTVCKHPDGTTYYPIDGLVIQDNVCKGLTYNCPTGALYPHGIFIRTFIDSLNAINIRNNTIELPDYNPASVQTAPGIAYQNSVVCLGILDYLTSTKIAIENNRNLNGQIALFKRLDANAIYIDLIGLDWYNNSSSWFPQDYPPNLSCLHYDKITKQIWLPIQLKTLVASGSLVVGKTYLVLGTGHIDYDDGSGLVSYINNETFVATAGHLTYVSGGSIGVYEHYIHCYRNISVEDHIPMTDVVNVAAGVSEYRLQTNIIHLHNFGINRIVFDTTDAAKLVYLPDATLYTGRHFRIAITKSATTGSRAVHLGAFDYTPASAGDYTTPSTGTAQLVTARTGTVFVPANVLQMSLGGTVAAHVLIDLVSDGVYWYLK